jgi:hypothetical protein
MIAVVLSRPRERAFISWAIRKLTHSDVSHASIHFTSDGGVLGRRIWVFESTAHGLGLHLGERWDKHNDALYKMEIKDEPLGQRALAIGMRELGSEYDFGGIGRFACYLFMRKFSASLAESVVRDTPNRMFCSEAVLRIVHVMDALSNDDSFAQTRSWRPDLTSPEDLKALRFCSGVRLAYASPGTV